VLLAISAARCRTYAVLQQHRFRSVVYLRSRDGNRSVRAVVVVVIIVVS
jgi:hypothetical protein